MGSRKPVDVTKLSPAKAIEYFGDKGVGLVYFQKEGVGPEGLTSFQKTHLADALNGHLGIIHTNTPKGKQLADDIISYLSVLGYETAYMKPTATQANWAHSVTRGHSTISWWRYALLKVEEWWFKMRDKRN